MENNSPLPESWVEQFCALKGCEFFCEVDSYYLSDPFNYVGLSNIIPKYEDALKTINDIEVNGPNKEDRGIEVSAVRLFGLIHARYILSHKGINAMVKKHLDGDFGYCRRAYCEGQNLLPVGMTDIPGEQTVKLYCPRCVEVYMPKAKIHQRIDGAYFGTSFPQMVFMTYPDLRPKKPTQRFVPENFGL